MVQLCTFSGSAGHCSVDKTGGCCLAAQEPPRPRPTCDARSVEIDSGALARRFEHHLVRLVVAGGELVHSNMNLLILQESNDLHWFTVYLSLIGESIASWHAFVDQNKLHDHFGVKMSFLEGIFKNLKLVWSTSGVHSLPRTFQNWRGLSNGCFQKGVPWLFQVGRVQRSSDGYCTRTRQRLALLGSCWNLTPALGISGVEDAMSLPTLCLNHPSFCLWSSIPGGAYMPPALAPTGLGGSYVPPVGLPNANPTGGSYVPPPAHYVAPDMLQAGNDQRLWPSKSYKILIIRKKKSFYDLIWMYFNYIVLTIRKEADQLLRIFVGNLFALRNDGFW